MKLYKTNQVSLIKLKSNESLLSNASLIIVNFDLFLKSDQYHLYKYHIFH